MGKRILPHRTTQSLVHTTLMDSKATAISAVYRALNTASTVAERRAIARDIADQALAAVQLLEGRPAAAEFAYQCGDKSVRVLP